MDFLTWKELFSEWMPFSLVSSFKPTGDQPQAIEKLSQGIKNGLTHQVLLGVTGSGKTFTLANLIAHVKKPTLVISHNKTLAAQLYQEFRDFFPKSAVSYFVSYYDYYLPEAYIPQTDTYIEKETEINEEIDKLRLQATASLVNRRDCLVVASVSCIYNIGSPKEYGSYIIKLKIKNSKLKINKIIKQLIELQYEREDYDFRRGTFRVRGDILFIWPAYQDEALRIEFHDDVIEKMVWINPLTGKPYFTKASQSKQFNNLTRQQPTFGSGCSTRPVRPCFAPDPTAGKCNNITIYPAKHYMVNPNILPDAFTQIKQDLEKRVKDLQKMGKILEAHRLEQRVNYDLEMIDQVGYVKGIENYSRYFDGRLPGQPPYTLLDYFPKDYLLVIDESHMTIPQLHSMYRGDLARKKTLIDYGFRLPSCLDNRPLKFEEFLRRVNQVIYTSATPDEWEIEQALKSTSDKDTSEVAEKRAKGPHREWPHPSNGAGTFDVPNGLSRCEGIGEQTFHNGIVEQLIRPTGILDPEIEIKPTKGQIDDLTKEIIKRKSYGERVLVTTLTKRLAEALAEHLNKLKTQTFVPSSGRGNSKLKADKTLRVHYLHSEIETLDRQDILDDLRAGKYDVVVGINLLREGLDLPEVSLVAILDADKEGFLRSKTSLVQTMGRAARHVRGEVIMYADEVTRSMREAIAEVARRRKVQLQWNKKHGITPRTIEKPIREKLIKREKKNESTHLRSRFGGQVKQLYKIDFEQLTPEDKKEHLKKLRRLMHKAAAQLDFELAAQIRDKIRTLE